MSERSFVVNEHDLKRCKITSFKTNVLIDLWLPQEHHMNHSVWVHFWSVCSEDLVSLYQYNSALCQWYLWLGETLEVGCILVYFGQTMCPCRFCILWTLYSIHCIHFRLWSLLRYDLIVFNLVYVGSASTNLFEIVLICK